MNKNKPSIFKTLLLSVLIIMMTLTGCGSPIPSTPLDLTDNIGTLSVFDPEQTVSTDLTNSLAYTAQDGTRFRYEDVPTYKGEPFIVLHDDIPWMDQKTTLKAGQYLLSEWDDLGRCGPAEMLATKSTLPQGERGPTGNGKPSGWVQNKYPGIVSSAPAYIYNRSHLLMYALSGLTEDMRNLITGTRYFNVEGMLPVEKEVLAAVENGSSVRYRVTPIFVGKELLARGVLMEAMSTDGEFHLCRFAYNVQPGIVLNYETGENHAKESEPVVINKKTMKYHRPSCPSATDISKGNRGEATDWKEAENLGYTPCGRCNP